MKVEAAVDMRSQLFIPCPLGGLLPRPVQVTGYGDGPACAIFGSRPRARPSTWVFECRAEANWMRPPKPTGPHAPNQPQAPWAPEERPERTRTLPESAKTHTADHAEYLSAPAEQQPHRAPRPHPRHTRPNRTRAGPGKLTCTRVFPRTGPGKLTRTRELPRTGPGKLTCTCELPRSTPTQKHKTPQFLHFWIFLSASFPGPVPGRSHVRVSFPGPVPGRSHVRVSWAQAGLGRGCSDIHTLQISVTC
jgi:hypothetical protein